MNISGKIVFILSLGVALAMGISTLKLSSGIQDEMALSATTNVQETVQLVAESLQHTRESEIARVYDLASTLRIDGQLENTLRQARENGAFLRAAVVSADTGTGVTTEGAAFSVSDLPIPDTALQGEKSISGAYVNGYGVWAYMVQCPIYDNGVLVGALYADLSIEDIGQVMPDKFYNDEGMLYLLDQTSKRFIVQPLSADLHISTRYDLQGFLAAVGVADTEIGQGVVKAIENNQWQIVRIYLDNTPSYMFFWPVAGSDWYLCGIVPESSIQRESIAVGNTIRTVTLLIAAASVLLILAVSWSARQKAKMEKSQQRYRMELFDGIARSINDVVFMFDCAAGRNEIVFDTIEHVLGVRYEGLQKLFAGEDFRQKYSGTALGEVMSGRPLDPRMNRTETLEWENPKTGERQWIHVETLCVELMGTPKCILSIYDVTQDMLMQDSLRTAALAAQNASRIKSEFLSHISHEIRTPMNAILGMLQLARQRMSAGESPQDYLAKAESASTQLLGLINDILDISRIESGKMLLAEEAFRLDELLNSLCDTCRFQASQKQQTFAVDLQACEKIEVIGDAVRLGQILTNLLSNAIKYTPPGGTVSLQGSSSPGGNQEYRQFTFVITDNGYGMSEEFQQKMFLPFERERTQAAQKENGTGLGLSIVQNLVSLMGGFIQVSSRMGGGTAFTVSVELKATLAEEAAPEPAPEAEIDLSRWHVLLAEDNALNLEITAEFLKLTHAEVDCAENGRIAYELFQKSPVGYYTLILMDVQMPVWDGIQATRAIRALERPDAGRVLIIAATANAFLEDEKQCLSAGMDGFVTKPLDRQKLYQKIRTLMEDRNETNSRDGME